MYQCNKFYQFGVIKKIKRIKTEFLVVRFKVRVEGNRKIIIRIMKIIRIGDQLINKTENWKNFF